MESSLQRGSTLEPERLSNFPKDYRRLCQHLAMAKSRRYAAGLITRLNGLVQQGYEALYGQTLNNKTTIIEFLIYGFPASLRANARFLWIAAIVFVLPYVAIMIACMVNDQMIYSVIDAGSVRMAESMYDPGLGKLGRERQSDSDIQMFGFYIYNNIGIAFKSFATGIFLGVGSLFVLAFNGLYIGAISGHLTALGYTETFYPFVIGHGSFELTAIVFSGAAGLKLGFSILAPGAHTRTRALQNAAKDAIKIMYGVFVMLLIAAFIEAFWSSSSTLPNAVKYSVGACLWVFVYYYCFFFAANRVATYRSQDAA
ncbi:MAG: putative membrane protein SpoIIM required for sporulation [Arenicella sp.]|jgi:uncharacterized membrane protein SpoIIM required for sporulation